MKKKSVLDKIKYKIVPPSGCMTYWRLYIRLKYIPLIWFKPHEFLNNLGINFTMSDTAYMQGSKERLSKILREMCDNIHKWEQEGGKELRKGEKGSVKEWYVIENL